MNRLIAGASFSILLVLGGATSLAAAEAEAQIPFTFKAAGLVSGTKYTFTFRLFESSTGGTAVWFEPKAYVVPPSLTLTHRLGSVRSFALGAGGDVPVPVDFSHQLWVEVRAGSRLVGTGRTKLSAAPYALWSAETGALPGAAECATGEVLFRTPEGWECGALRPFQNGIGICTGADCLLSCALGWDNCDLLQANGCETALASDANNCNACGTVCPPAENAAPVCAAGNCGFACSPGYGNCDGAVSNGCEANLTSSTDNCGGCGLLCPSPLNATGFCSGGGCQIACTPSWANCDVNAMNGCETNTSTDVNHCGGCQIVCPALANASRGCVAAMCTLTSCNAGFGNCNDIATDGCEVNLSTTATNCGACGNVCPARANASSTCTAGACGFACNVGFGNCNNIATDGCETNLSNTVAHCGGCNTVCPSPANATATCAAAVCGLLCNTGYGNCNNSVFDGCEVDLRSDPKNCGTCGHACAAEQSCTAGICI